ncbi:MAG: hypothetical protein ACYTGL_18570 [Planctomycetota bacterium]|jgi:hypothetical protein
MTGNDPWMQLLFNSQADLPQGLVTYVLARDMLVAFASLVLGFMCGRSLSRRLQDSEFDALFVFPWAQPRKKTVAESAATDSTGEAEDVSLSSTIGLALRFTVWLGGAALLAYLHGQTAIYDWTVAAILKLWSVAVLVLLGLWIARQITQAVIGLMNQPGPREKVASWLDSSQDSAADVDPEGVHRVVGILTYAVVMSPLVVAGIELAGSSATATAVLRVWELLFRLATGLGALFIGWIGVSFLKVLRIQSDQQPRRLEQTLVFAVTILALLIVGDGLSILGAFFESGGSSAGGVLALVAGLIALVLLFRFREDVADAWAGIVLRNQQTKRIYFDGEVARIRRINFVTSLLELGEQEFTLRNTEVLKATRDGVPRPKKPKVQPEEDRIEIPESIPIAD